MSGVVPLDAARHRDLRLEPRREGAARRYAPLGLSELARAAADFPICLAKEAETGRFNLIALLSLAEPRNLFWFNGEWQATYRPRAADAAPFRLDPAGACGLAIDERSAALGSNGTRLFDDDGRPAEFLVEMQSSLEFLVADIAQAQAMVDSFAQYRLIRRLRLVLRHDDGDEHEIDGLYSLGADAMAALADEAVLALHRADRLGPAAIMTASLAQIERLRQLNNISAGRSIARFHLWIDE